MNNKELALEFGTGPTGNARAYAFSDEPLVRMRNTAFLPGQHSLEEMIASIEDGYYLIETNNGQAILPVSSCLVLLLDMRLKMANWAGPLRRPLSPGLPLMS